MFDPAAAFHGVRPAGAGWMARCPAHDDGTASLKIDRGDDGRWLLHCHANCSTEAVLSAAGLHARDLFPDHGPATLATIVATYPYPDEGGVHLYDVVRFTPKDFRQRRADGTWNMRGVRRVLYRLDALQGQTVVYLVEGEKDADALRAIGLVATTAPGGAGKWTDDYTRQLVAAQAQKVVVLPDHDDAGRAHADTAARSCHAAGLQLKVVTLPDVPTKGDVSDYLAAGHTKADLVALVKATPIYVPSAVEPRRISSTGPAPVLVCLADVTPEAVDFLWAGRIARRKLQLIVGDPGLGKSTIMLDVAARVTRGAEWPDGGRAPLGNAIILSAEDGLADTVRPRLDVLHADVTRIQALTGTRLANGEERSISLARDVAVLEQAIDQVGDVALVVIDPISAYLGDTDSYKDGEVRSILAPVAALADRTGVAIVAVMHLGKGTQRPALYRALGSVAFVAAARIVLAVAPHPEDDTKRVLAPVKANVCAPAPTLAYRLDAGRLVWDVDPVLNVDVDALLSPRTDRHERRAADDWLRTALAGGSRSVRDLERLATAEGLVWRTVERAKERLHVEAELIGFGPKGRWYWSLPQADTPCVSTETATRAEVSVSVETLVNHQRPTLIGDVAVSGPTTVEPVVERPPASAAAWPVNQARDDAWARSDALFTRGWTA